MAGFGVQLSVYYPRKSTDWSTLTGACNLETRPLEMTVIGLIRLRMYEHRTVII